MMDRTPTYRMQVETWPQDHGVGVVHEGFQGHGRGRGEELVEVTNKLSVITAVKLDNFCTNV